MMLKAGAALRPLTSIATGRRSVVVKSTDSDLPKKTESFRTPEWLPEPVLPVLRFFNADNVTLDNVVEPVQKSELYNKYIKDVAESEVATQVAEQSFGWKELPEAINGRAAMLGFVFGLFGELFGSSPLLKQTAAHPQLVLLVLALVTVGSVAPVFYGTKGDYLESLKDIYSLPKGWFTGSMERIHGRLAMLGLTSLLAVELLTGNALL